MDYGFAPADDAHNANLRAMFTRRPNTTLVHRRRVTTIRDFLARLGADPAVTPPIGDLVVGSHAGSEGFLTIRLSRVQAGATDFEALHASLGTGPGSVAIPDTLIGHTPGDPITHSFHVKGCNVGADRKDRTRIPPAAPLLVKLKEALGGHVNVTAPKHFHGIVPAPGTGIFEYMAYEFKIGVQPTVGARGRLVGFADRAAALTAFQGAQFRYIDGTLIPDADWEPLIPGRIDRTDDRSVAAPLGATVGTRQTITVRRQFRVQRDNVSWPIDFPAASDVPTSRAGRLTALRASIASDGRFDAAHPYPLYERFGFDSFANYFDGYHWTFRVGGRFLRCTGTRFVYTVLLPIVDRATGNVIFNFYPNAGSTITAVTNGLRESDNLFFGRS